jgi:hypothetical protein
MSQTVCCPRCRETWLRASDDVTNFSVMPGYEMLFFEKLCPSCLQKWKKIMTPTIRSLQIRDGYDPCFGKKNECDQTNCLFRLLCLSEHHEAKELIATG